MRRFFRRLRSEYVRSRLRDIWRLLTCPPVALIYRYGEPTYISIDGHSGPTFKRYTDILRSDPCSYCGLPGPSTIDHVMPKSRGGKDYWENFSSACKHCNMDKAAMPLLMYLMRRDEPRRRAARENSIKIAVANRAAANKARCAANAAFVRSLAQ